MSSFGRAVPSSASSCTTSSLVASESSCEQNSAPGGSMNNIFDSGHNFPPPPHLFPGTCYPQVSAPFSSSGNCSPLMLSPPRFPPPPNSSYPPAYHPNMTSFESLPASHYSCKLRASDTRGLPYDGWGDSVPSVAMDNSSKFVSYWPFPGFNSYNNMTKDCPTKSDGLYPAISASPQYPLCNTASKIFSSKFSSSAREFSTPVSSPNAVVPSTSYASVSSPHVSSVPPPYVPFDFPPTTSRFSFNPHASAFYPGKDSQTSNRPCDEDISHYNGPMSNSDSRLPSANILSSPHQVVNCFHDASSRPMHSPEIAPRPIKSTSPTFSSGPHSLSGSSAPSSSPIFATHSLSSRSTSYWPVCSDGSGARESSCDFPPTSSLHVDMPVPPASSTLFNLYNTGANSPLPGKLKSHKMEEDDTMEGFFSESGALLYHQYMSPEEWRWNQYEPVYAQGLVDPAGCVPRNCRSTYSYFQNRNRAGPSCMSDAVSGDRNSLFAVNMIERSKIPNQPGSSLKLAASALAEMLAFKSNVATNSTGQNMMAHIASLSGSARASDVTHLSEGFRLPGRQERLPDDCCSSSGSVPVPKDASFVSKRETPSRGPTEKGTLSRLHSSDILIKRRSADHVDDVSKDVTNDSNSVPIAIKSTPLNALGQSQSSTNAQPLGSWLSQTVGPQVAATKSVRPGAYNVNSGGSVQSASTVSTGCGVLQDLNLESGTSQNLNPLFTQSLDRSQKTESGRFRKVTTQPVGALSSEDDTSIAGPFKPNPVACEPSTAGPNRGVTSSCVESQILVNASHSDHSPTNSMRTSTFPLLSQGHIETSRGSLSTMANGVGSRVFSNMSRSSPQTPNAMHISGFQSLTTSISNLTKVLLSFCGPMLQQGDLTWVQESLQSAILRLSECLLLEQARLSASNVAGSCATSDPAGREHWPTNDPSEFLDLFPGAGASGNDLESYKRGVLEERPTLAMTKQGHMLFESIVKTSTDKVETDKPSPEVNGSEKINGLFENLDSMSKHSVLNASANVSPDKFSIASEEGHSSEPRRGRVHDILEFLRDQEKLDLTALKKLVAAEAREEKLKDLVQHLREKLEFEREENKGTAYLCGKIMQGENMLSSKVQAEARQAAERASAFTSRSVEKSSEDRESAFLKATPSATALVSAQPSSSGLAGVEARLAILQGRWGWDTEIGLFTETEPCTPDDISSPDVWNGGREGLSGPKPPVIDTMDLGKCSPLITPMLSQIQNITESPLVQSELPSSMGNLWSHYDVLDSQYTGFDSEKGVEDKETRNDTGTPVCDNLRSVEARAQTIRSRPDLINIDGVEGDAVNLNDSLDRKWSSRDSVDSGCPTLENDRCETMNEICLVRLLDSDEQNSQQAVTRITSSSLQRGNEGGGMNSEAETVLCVIQSQDLDEEAGWEHVRLPRQDSD